jgi:hypothetical protein
VIDKLWPLSSCLSCSSKICLGGSVELAVCSHSSPRGMIPADSPVEDVDRLCHVLPLKRLAVSKDSPFCIGCLLVQPF